MRIGTVLTYLQEREGKREEEGGRGKERRGREERGRRKGSRMPSLSLSLSLSLSSLWWSQSKPVLVYTDRKEAPAYSPHRESPHQRDTSWIGHHPDKILVCIHPQRKLQLICSQQGMKCWSQCSTSLGPLPPELCYPRKLPHLMDVHWGYPLPVYCSSAGLVPALSKLRNGPSCSGRLYWTYWGKGWYLAHPQTELRLQAGAQPTKDCLTQLCNLQCI